MQKKVPKMFWHGIQLIVGFRPFMNYHNINSMKKLQDLKGRGSLLFLILFPACSFLIRCLCTRWVLFFSDRFLKPTNKSSVLRQKRTHQAIQNLKHQDFHHSNYISCMQTGRPTKTWQPLLPTIFDTNHYKNA